MVSYLALLLGSTLASGINLYLTLLAIGVYARLGSPPPDLASVVAPFGSMWVMVPAVVLFLAEFLADKVPFVDNFWDLIHTVIRPVGAVFIVLALARDLDTALQIGAALGGGTLALGAHGAKSGLRAAARLNPEPISNALSSTALSLIEDVGVGGLMLLVFLAPLVAVGVVAVAIVGMLWFSRLIYRRMTRSRPAES